MIEFSLERRGKKEISTYDIQRAWERTGYQKELGNVEVDIDVFSKERVLSEDVLLALLDLEGAAWKKRKMKLMVVNFHEGKGYKVKVKIKEYEREEQNEDSDEEKTGRTG